MKRLNPLLAAVLAGITTFAALPTTAEQIEIPLGQQGETKTPTPPRGVNKAQVEAVYGEPVSKRGPTGEPAIYIWEYPSYTVYFEGDKVLHSVLKHAPRES